MSHDDKVHFRLTKSQQEAIRRIGRDGTHMVPEWVSIGESVNDVMFKLARNHACLDTDWITEYLAHHGTVNHQEEN